VIAAGMTFVILTGGIDLSVGSVLAVSGAVIAGLLSAGRPLLVGIGAGLAVGAALGLLAGLIVTRGKVQPFIATLGMLTIGPGLLNSGQPTAGVGFELDAIAAVVLGGTTLAGGEGSIGGTLQGAFIIGVINNGLNLLNVNPFYQQVVKGAVILLAVLLDRRLR